MSSYIERKVSFRKVGTVVRLSMYDAHNSHDKFFEIEAPANDPDKLALMLEAAISKGMSKPRRRDSGSWWDSERD